MVFYGRGMNDFVITCEDHVHRYTDGGRREVFPMVGHSRCQFVEVEEVPRAEAAEVGGDRRDPDE